MVIKYLINVELLTGQCVVGVGNHEDLLIGVMEEVSGYLCADE